MRIAIATVKVPFVYGGAEILAEGLRDALCAAGHEAEIFAFPWKWYPPSRILEQMLACRFFDVAESEGKPIDRVIGLKFPAYYIPHPNKVLWILHQHRQAYDLWDHPLAGDLMHHPDGQQVRGAIENADRQLMTEAQGIYTISRNVSARLRKFCGMDSIPLYHPPLGAELFHCAEPEPYLFFPSRIWPTKRQALVLEALTHTGPAVRVKFAGAPNNPDYGIEIRRLAERLGVSDQVEWLGNISEEHKRDLYARSMAVIYPPIDEDYGYVTLEAMLASKAVITCSDSGGTLEFVQHERNGLVADPAPASLGNALTAAWADPERTRAWGQASRRRYQDLDISWANALRRLLS